MLRPLPSLAALYLAVLTAAAQTDSGFSAYWHRGEAELNRYALIRERYGELHQGYAVLVFVTEDMRLDLQVKDEGAAADAPTRNVLKLNRIERFATGLYDYSLMASVFTPADPDSPARPATLKATASVQDWCGHVWQQLNLREREYRVVGHSYFEREGDSESRLPAALLEDEVLLQVRLAPSRLPVGDVEVIPGLFRSRLAHRPLAVETARAELVDAPAEDGTARRTYRLRYRDGRVSEVTFDAGFPHRIAGFEERIEAGGDRRLLVRGVREQVMMAPYWEQHRQADAPLRRQLGLPAPGR